MGRREADDRITLTDVGTDNVAYLALRIGAHYLVWTARTEMYFDDDLHLTTGGELPALAPSGTASAQVLAAADGQVTVLLRSLGYGGLRPLAVSRLIDGTWDTTSLAEAPTELYSTD